MLTLFLGSKIGRYALAGAVAVLAITIFIARVFAAGKKSALIDGMEQQLKNVKAKQDVQADLSRATDARKQQLRDKWTRP